jgi:hypothetical protein
MSAMISFGWARKYPIETIGAVMRPLSLAVTCVQVRIDDFAATVVMSARHYQYSSHTA